MRGIEKIAAQIIGEAEEKKAAIYEEIQHKIDELNIVIICHLITVCSIICRRLIGNKPFY